MIHLSKTASIEIQRLNSSYHTLDSYLRIGVQEGGCAGFYYTMEFEQVAQAGDLIYDCGTIKVIVDSQKLEYINGLTIDYSEDLMGGGFRFHNPNALQHCGCGNSFLLNQENKKIVTTAN